MGLKSLKATSKGGEGFENPPAGNHAGYLVGVIDLGTQTKSYKGESHEAYSIYLCWELTDCPMSGTKGVNHVIGKEYTYSFHTKSSLRQMVEGWSGRTGKFNEGEEFDLRKLFGVPCLVNVSNSDGGEGRTFANLKGVTPLPKGMQAPKPQRSTLWWEIETGTLEQLDWLPWSYGNKIADLVQASPEWKARGRGGNGKATPAPAEDEEMAMVGQGQEEESDPF